MLRLPADLQTSQWRRHQCGARRLEGVAAGGDFEAGPRMGELWNHWFWVTLALGQIHLPDQAEPDINVLKVNPGAVEEPFTISPGSHLAFRLH